jgi:hypothetical protein
MENLGKPLVSFSASAEFFIYRKNESSNAHRILKVLSKNTSRPAKAVEHRFLESQSSRRVAA